MNYYNENDPYAAAWLRGLIKAGFIPAGDVDDRDIRDVRPADLVRYDQCHFFAGVGGWPRALRLAGEADDEPWWTGSCPCQPFSSAGQGSGFADERHLWPAFFHLIRVCRPGRIIGEQVASADGLLWLDLVHDDMEGEDYAFGAPDLCAAGVGSPQARQRLFWLAYTENANWRSEQQALRARRWWNGFTGSRAIGPVARADGSIVQRIAPAGQQPVHEQGLRPSFWSDSSWIHCSDGLTRPFEPGSFPLAYGLPAGVERSCSELDRLAVRAARTYRIGATRGYGNAIVAELGAEIIGATR